MMHQTWAVHFQPLAKDPLIECREAYEMYFDEAFNEVVNGILPTKRDIKEPTPFGTVKSSLAKLNSQQLHEILKFIQDKMQGYKSHKTNDINYNSKIDRFISDGLAEEKGRINECTIRFDRAMLRPF